MLAPRVATAPAVVAVEVDGGRLRTRAAGRGPGVHAGPGEGGQDRLFGDADRRRRGRGPVPGAAAVVRRTAADSTVGAANGQPGRRSVIRRRISAGGRGGERIRGDRWDPRRGAVVAPAVGADVRGQPDQQPVVRAVDGRGGRARNFYAAGRRAFVADGQAYNWTIQARLLPGLRAGCRLAARGLLPLRRAQAVGAEGERLVVDLRWLRACWQGQVAAVLEHMATFQERLGRPPPGEDVPATDPRRVLAEALTYLRNNASRMDYPRYRRAGLPTTSSLVESLVGEFNARVKGKQKFWNRPAGAEAILHVRAVLLSDAIGWNRYFRRRPAAPTAVAPHDRPHNRKAVHGLQGSHMTDAFDRTHLVRALA